MSPTNIIHRWADIEKLRAGYMISPHFVDLHTSNICNQNCVGCAYSGMLDKSYLPEETHFRIVDELIDVGVKAFDFAGGGEPLALPYAAKLMRHIRECGAHYAGITNGTLLNEEIRKEVLEGASYVRISLEASNPDAYCTYKRVNIKHWDAAIGNAHRLVEEKRKSGSSCEIALKFSVGKTLRGYWHYIGLIELGRALGVDRVNVKAIRHEPEELTIEERKYQESILRIACDEMKVSQEWIRHWITPLDESLIPQCWLNPFHVVVDYRGDMYLCCFYYYRQDEFYLGNLIEKRFSDIWFSENHQMKIKGIKREECMKVDCKFAHHHLAVNQALKNGNVNWL